MKLNRKILATAAIVLPLYVGAGSALAYFTDSVSSAGGYAVEVGAPNTDIEEGFVGWTKDVRVTNNGDVPVYVRVKAFKGSQYSLSYSGEKWIDGKDGYYYYDAILKKGDRTEPSLKIKIDGVPQNAIDKNKDAFNVVVVYERAPVKYDKTTGDPLPWSSEEIWKNVIEEQKEFPSDQKTESSDKTEDSTTGSGDDSGSGNPDTPDEQQPEKGGNES